MVLRRCPRLGLASRSTRSRLSTPSWPGSTPPTLRRTWSRTRGPGCAPGRPGRPMPSTSRSRAARSVTNPAMSRNSSCWADRRSASGNVELGEAGGDPADVFAHGHFGPDVEHGVVGAPQARQNTFMASTSTAATWMPLFAVAGGVVVISPEATRPEPDLPAGDVRRAAHAASASKPPALTAGPRTLTRPSSCFGKPAAPHSSTCNPAVSETVQALIHRTRRPPEPLLQPSAWPGLTC